MSVDKEMTEFVDNDVVNTLRRGFDELGVQRDAGSGGAASPALVHFFQPNCR